MLTLTFLLLLGAFVLTLLSAIGRAPLWVAVLLLVMIEALQVIPR